MKNTGTLTGTPLTGAAAAAEACRTIAAELGADIFTLLLARAGGLTPSPEPEFAAPPAVSRLLAAAGGVLAARLSTSAKPCFWAAEDGISCPRWADVVASPLPGTSGIAFPVGAEGGPAGLFIFLGTRIAAAEADLADIHARCFALFRAMERPRPIDLARAGRLSKRERQCLALAAEGSTSEEIAATLGLSVHTANQYLTNIVLKLDAANRIHAVAKAMRLGLID